MLASQRGRRHFSEGRAGRMAELRTAGSRHFHCSDSDWRGAAGKGHGACVCAGKGHPTSREPQSVSSSRPARAAAATLWPGRPEAPAPAESRFCAAAPAPVSLTLEPAAYLSNWKGNSAVAEGKKITSVAERGGKRPRHLPATLSSPERGLALPPEREAWRPASVLGPVTLIRSQAAGPLWAPLWGLSQGTSPAFLASWFPLRPDLEVDAGVFQAVLPPLRSLVAAANQGAWI